MISRYAALGLGAILLVLVSLAGVDSCRRHQVASSETQAAIHQGEANAHAQAAQSIPDHSQALAEAQAGVDRARAEVARLRKLLAAKPSVAVPDPAGEGPALPPVVPPDLRDSTIAALESLVTEQDAQIGSLKSALSDEQKRSTEQRLRAEALERSIMAQQAATEAWKKAVTASRWRGRAEGFVAGVALGYLEGKR